MSPRSSLVLLVSMFIFLPTAAADDRFSALHRALNDAADATLVRSRSFMEEAQSTQPESAKRTSDADVSPVQGSEEISASSRAIKRAETLKPFILSILREERVPDFLMAVVLVESRARGDAYSRKGAAGLWQLMPDTARDYGLTVSGKRDDRYDLLLATRAAARHLRRLFQVFGDWELVLAAYNYGEGRLQKKLIASRTFSQMVLRGTLPDETKRYVPAVFQAAQRLKLAID